jgi:hypothetical protein
MKAMILITLALGSISAVTAAETSVLRENSVIDCEKPVAGARDISMQTSSVLDKKMSLNVQSLAYCWRPLSVGKSSNLD